MNTTMKDEGRSTLVQPIFGPGMLLQHGDLELQTNYTRELNRLMFRSLFGCGVVCGLNVKVDEERRRVIVQRGLAIDANGDPIEVPRDHSLAASEDCMEIEKDLWVVLCGTVKYCVPRSATCSSDDEPAAQPTRAIHGYEIRLLTELPKCVCSCTKEETQEGDVRTIVTDENCYKDHIDGECACTCDGCSGTDCKCVLLARIYLKEEGEKTERVVDHSVRRFIRPQLLTNPMPDDEPTTVAADGGRNAAAQQLAETIEQRDKLRDAVIEMEGMVTTQDNKEKYKVMVEALGEAIDTEEVAAAAE